MHCAAGSLNYYRCDQRAVVRKKHYKAKGDNGMNTNDIAKHIGETVTLGVYSEGSPRERWADLYFGELLAVDVVPDAEQDDGLLRAILNDAQTGRDVNVVLRAGRFSLEPGQKVTISEEALKTADRRLRQIGMALEVERSDERARASEIEQLKNGGRKRAVSGVINVPKIMALKVEHEAQARKVASLTKEQAELSYMRQRIWRGLILAGRRQYRQMCRAELDRQMTNLEGLMEITGGLIANSGVAGDASTAACLGSIQRSVRETIHAIEAL